MNKVVDKIKRVNESIKRNGLNTEFRRLFQLIKCGKAIPDEYKEWMIMNEPDEKNLKEAREYKSWFNCSFARTDLYGKEYLHGSVPSGVLSGTSGFGISL